MSSKGIIASAPQPSGEGKADVPSFAALNNSKILFPAGSEEFLVVEKHFLMQLMRSSISSIYVDEAWYRTKYPDIGEFVARGRLPSAKEHYVRFGYFEHRMPYEIFVSEDWYLSIYPDIRAAVQREDFVSGQEHFERVGFREGRMPYPRFELRRGQ